jgi:hypothetical protein
MCMMLTGCSSIDSYLSGFSSRVNSVITIIASCTFEYAMYSNKLGILERLYSIRVSDSWIYLYHPTFSGRTFVKIHKVKCEGRLKISWTHLITPSLNFVEVR